MLMQDFTPMLIQTKDGRLVQTRPHYATFGPRHNGSKAKIVMVLSREPYGLSVSQLYRRSGVSYSYLRSKLGKWCKWQYLIRRVAETPGGRPVYVYSLAARGRRFLAIIPNDWVQVYAKEVRDFRDMVDPYEQ